MANNIRIMSDVSLNGTLSFESNYTGFPTNPAPRTLIVKDGIPYLYTELVNGSGYFTWTPIGARQAAHLHTQGVASTEWIVTHNFNSENFGYFVYDPDHNLVLANTQIINPNTVKVLLTMAITGTAVFFSMESIFTQMVNASQNVQINTITLRDAAGVLTVNNNPVAMAEAVAASFAQVYTKNQTDNAIIDAVAVETAARIAADTLITNRLDDLIGSASALDSLNEVVAAFEAADSNLSTAITNALGTHTSELDVERQERIDADLTNLTVAKDYADDVVALEADARVSGDLTTLNAAKLHTDTSIQSFAATGVVDRANKLATPRYINGIAFDGSADITLTTDQVGEGTYKYYTDSRARSAISVTGAGSYNPTTGVINVTGGVTSVAGRTGAVTLTKADVGLGSVDNVSAAALRDRTTHTGVQPISTVTGLQPALDSKVNIGEAITRADLDTSYQNWLEPVKGLIEGPVTLQSLVGLQGFQVGDRVLVISPTDTSIAGIYLAAEGAWGLSFESESTSAKSFHLPNAYITVDNNGAVAPSTWKCVSSLTDLLDGYTRFEKHSLQAQRSAPLASVAYSGFMSAADKAKLDGIPEGGQPATLPEATYTTLGGVIVGTGLVVDAGVLSVESIIRKFADNIGGSTSIVVNHGMNTKDVQVQTYLVSTGATVDCDVVRTSPTSITLGFATAPAAGSIRVVVVG